MGGSNGSTYASIIVGFLVHCHFHDGFYLVRFFYGITYTSTVFSKSSKIYWSKFYTKLRISKKGHLLPSNHSKCIIFDNNYFDWQVILYCCSKFTHQHCKSTITYERYTLSFWICNLCCYSIR